MYLYRWDGSVKDCHPTSYKKGQDNTAPVEYPHPCHRSADTWLHEPWKGCPEHSSPARTLPLIAILPSTFWCWPWRSMPADTESCQMFYTSSLIIAGGKIRTSICWPFSYLFYNKTNKILIYAGVCVGINWPFKILINFFGHKLVEQM